MNILLLYGGRSGEHEVSCVSAAFVEQNLQAAGFHVVPVYIDHEGQWQLQRRVHKFAVDNEANPCGLSFAQPKPRLGDIEIDFGFSIVHGTTGEDGALQGLFEMYRLPYAGCGVAASAICMDKFYMREIFSRAGLPQVKYIRLDLTHQAKMDDYLRDIETSLGYPVFTKPCNMGSSVGVNRAVDFNSLKKAVTDSFLYDDHILIEQGKPVREIELAVLGNYPHYIVSGAGEIIPAHEFYSYEAKYVDPNGASLVMPAEISPEVLEKLQQLARQAFAAVRGDGFARVDFFISKEDGSIYVNEINTLPGFTPVSMFPMLFAKAGIAGPELLKKIVELGLQRYERRQSLRHRYAH